MIKVGDFLIYILDDEQDILDLLDLEFTNRGFNVGSFKCVKELISALDLFVPDAMIADLMLANGETRFNVLKGIREKFPDMDIYIVSGFLTEENSDVLKGLNILDITAKPFEMGEYANRIIGNYSIN